MSISKPSRKYLSVPHVTDTTYRRTFSRQQPLFRRWPKWSPTSLPLAPMCPRSLAVGLETVNGFNECWGRFSTIWSILRHMESAYSLYDVYTMRRPSVSRNVFWEAASRASRATASEWATRSNHVDATTSAMETRQNLPAAFRLFLNSLSDLNL